MIGKFKEEGIGNSTELEGWIGKDERTEGTSCCRKHVKIEKAVSDCFFYAYHLTILHKPIPIIFTLPRAKFAPYND